MTDMIEIKRASAGYINPMDDVITQPEARDLLRDLRVELGMDQRSAQQYAYEFLQWVEAVAEREGEAMLEYELARGAQIGHTALTVSTQSPYFVRF